MNKKIVLLLYIFLNVNIYTFSQSMVKYNSTAIISPQYNGLIEVFNKNGKQLKKIKNNIAEKDFLLLKILNENRNMFYVSISYSVKGFITKGWIKKSNVIGIFSRNYSSTLTLYSNTNKKSKIVFAYKKYINKLLTVLSCNKNNWLKVQVKIDGIIYKGWIPPEMLCSNPYTTCN